MHTENLAVEIDGQEVRYLKTGSGPPLVLIHGLVGGSFCWRFNVSALSPRHTIYAVDLPGFGENDAPRHLNCGMKAQSDRLSHLLETLRLESVDVVGASWSGAVAMFLAAMSSRVRSMVLVAPVNPWSEAGTGRIRFLNTWLGGALLRAALPISRPLHRLAIQRMYGDPKRIPPGTVEGYSALLTRRKRVHSILNTLHQWESDVNALRGAISRIRVRSLLIWGTRDGAVDLKSSEALMHILPDCQRALIQGAGHLPFEETPEEFNRLVLDFLATAPPLADRAPD